MIKKNAGSSGDIAGFTLLEVLIGMSLLGVMMLLLLGSLRTCIQNWDAGEKKIAEVNRMAILQQFFSVRLRNIRPLSDNFSEEEEVFSFQGEKQRMQFVAAMPASAGRRGLQKFSLSLQEDEQDESWNLLVHVVPFFPVVEGSSWDVEPVVVLRDIADMQFRYYGLDAKSKQPYLGHQWLEHKNLPSLIGISIELTNGQQWPEFIVAPKNEVFDVPGKSGNNKRRRNGRAAGRKNRTVANPFAAKAI